MSEETSWIWGRHPVLEALRAGVAQLILVSSGNRAASIIDDIRRLADHRGIPVRVVPHHEMQNMAPDANTQGVAAQVRQRRILHIDEMLSSRRGASEPTFLLALDQIQDPQNLGSLLRTSSAAGVHGVIIPERRSAHMSGTVNKVSAGAASHVPIAEVTNLARTLEQVRESNTWVIGLDESAPSPLFEADLTVPLTLVVGSEGSGLRRLTREHCDLLVSLPMRGPIGSLNAAVAGSIALFEVVRQRLFAHSS